MIRGIFVEPPVRALTRTRRLFEALGLTFDARFTNEQAACREVAPNIHAMLLVEPFFQGFTKLPLADAAKATEVLTALPCDSRAEVDARVAKALAAGGSTPDAPMDHGSMYQHGFADPGGHPWELFWMDEATAPAQR